MRLALNPLQQMPPVANAITTRAFDTDMRGRSEESVLQILPKAVGDSESNDERGHSCSNADDRDRRDDSNHSLAALGPEISRRDEEFEAHCKAEYNTRNRVIGRVKTRSRRSIALPKQQKAGLGRPWVPSQHNLLLWFLVPSRT